VLGGIGGAILLGGIALVCWRIWGRKREGTGFEDVHSGTTSAVAENKPPSNSGIADDDSHMDRYNNPHGRPNAAANF